MTPRRVLEDNAALKARLAALSIARPQFIKVPMPDGTVLDGYRIGPAEIESCLVVTSVLPRREVEVTARILYGPSSIGIALDLGVSEETVKTYRKRAYHRLGIGSERELLTWYLARWSHWRGHRYDPKSRLPH